MASPIPPLASLRAFEAAARLENFARAADELFVTHGAISHQVKALEEHVGVALFARRGRGVALTADGRELATAVRAALVQLADAAQVLRRRAQSQHLSISTLPSFGARWLMPRIGDFLNAHPDWSVNIDSSADLVDFRRDGFDVAVRFGRGSWPGVHSDPLMGDAYILVASPALAGGLPPDPGALADFPLLRADAEAWLAWCAAAGVTVALPERGVGYQDMGVMLQSAIDGHGILLVRRTIATVELAKGTLVALFDISTPSPDSYWIVYPVEPPPTPRTLAFRDWLLAQAALDRAAPRVASRRAREPVATRAATRPAKPRRAAASKPPTKRRSR